MRIATESFLLSAAAQQRSLDENLRMFSSFESYNDRQFDIFLSHSYLDKKIINGIYNVLKKMGYSVYVDWIVDPQLDRNNVTKASAELVRMRMDQSRSLLYAISTKSDMSKWMPWELGYIDGHTNHKCALLPVAKVPYEQFTRSEYLLLYPIAKLLDNFSDKFVISESESSTMYNDIDNWIRR